MGNLVVRRIVDVPHVLREARSVSNPTVLAPYAKLPFQIQGVEGRGPLRITSWYWGILGRVSTCAVIEKEEFLDLGDVEDPYAVGGAVADLIEAGVTREYEGQLGEGLRISYAERSKAERAIRKGSRKRG